jgi:hypothetical protein
MYHGSVASIASVWGPGWQLADGTNGTANLKDRFVIGAGNTYAVNAVGGSATTTLTNSQLPAHNHVINIGDPGHTHTISQTPHAHSVYDPGHAHSVYDPGHAHGITVAQNYGVPQNGTTPGNWFLDPVGGATSAAGTGIGIYAAGTGISIYAQYANVANVSSGTGIYATSNNTGSGAAYNSLPPYYALCFIEYTGIGA